MKRLLLSLSGTETSAGPAPHEGARELRPIIDMSHTAAQVHEPFSDPEQDLDLRLRQLRLGLWVGFPF
jgi:hypothetical protein